MLKFNSYTLKKLEALFGELEYRIIYEKGTFQSGYCIVEAKNIIVINKFYDTEARINSMLDVLSQVKIDEEKLSPASIQLLKKIRKSAENLENEAVEKEQKSPTNP